MVEKGLDSLFLGKIPNELIAHIFWMCIPEFDDHPCSTEKTIEVLRLGTICRSLRHLVYSTPALWATVTFRPWPRDDFGYISEWLGRAGMAQLALRIDTISVTRGDRKLWDWDDEKSVAENEAAEIENRARTSTLICTIRPFLASCVHLDLRLTYIARELDFQSPITLPALKRLNLDIEGTSEQEHDELVIGVDDGVAPNLVGVGVIGPWVEFTRIPWHNIVDLELGRMLFSECGWVLAHTPMLQQVVIKNVYADNVERASLAITPPISLPHLVSFDWQEEASPLFAKLATPSLTHFRYHPPAPDYDIEPLTTFLQQAALTLSVIVVEDIPEDGLLCLWTSAPNATVVSGLRTNGGLTVERLRDFSFEDLLGGHRTHATYFLPIPGHGCCQ